MKIRRPFVQMAIWHNFFSEAGVQMVLVDNLWVSAITLCAYFTSFIRTDQVPKDIPHVYSTH